MSGMGEATEWAIRNAIRAEHLGRCWTCTGIVRAGTECSGCLEEAGVARHARHCDDPECGPVL